MANSMAVIPDNEIIVEGGGLVPSTQGASSGDVLTVGQNGPEWAAPGGGGGGGVPDVADPLYIDTDDAVALKYGSGLFLEDSEEAYNDTLAVALSGTGGLYYDDMEDNGLAVQLDPAGGLENYIDDGVQVGLRAKVDGTTIDINANGELEAIGGGGGTDLNIIEDNVLDLTPDGKSLLFNDAGDVGGGSSYEKTAVVAWANGGLYGVINKPWNYRQGVSNMGTSNMLYLFTSTYVADDYHLAWIPVATGSQPTVYARYKDFTRYSVSDYGFYDANGWRYIGTGYYYGIEVPPGTNPTWDTTKFDVVGDWSTVASYAPFETWYLGFVNENGQFTSAGISYTSTNTTWSVGGARTKVRLAPGGGLSRGYYGLSVTNPLPSTLGTAGQVLTVNSGATGVEWATPSSGGGASGYFVPFYDSTLQMIDGTVIASYGTYIEGDVASRLAQYWDDTSVHHISINLPASMGPANDLYVASLYIELKNSSTPTETIYLVRNTYSSNVGLGNIPPNYSYGNMTFNFTIGPRELPTGYVISSFRYHIEDSTNGSQSFTLPDWISLDSTARETWSRDTAGITLTQIPATITAV